MLHSVRASECHGILLQQNAERIGGDSVAGRIEDLRGVRVTVSWNPYTVRRHGFIITQDRRADSPSPPPPLLELPFDPVEEMPRF